MNITESVRFSLKDKGWWRTYLMVGVHFLIPVAGILIVLGWQRRVFKNFQQGNQYRLPSVKIKRDLQNGIAPFTALMNIVVPVVVILGLVMITEFTAGFVDPLLKTFVLIPGYLLIGTIGLMAILSCPEFLRRAFVEGELFPLLRSESSMIKIKSVGSYYGVVVGDCLGAILLGVFGVLFLGVGVLISGPWGLVIMAHLIARYERTNERSEI